MLPATGFAEVGPSTLLWRFGAADFDYAVDQISIRSEPDERAIALSLALAIFGDEERPDAWHRRLLAATEDDETLRASLTSFLSPPDDSALVERLRQDRARELRNERASRRQARQREEWREALRRDVESLRNLPPGEPPGISYGQEYLLHRMREADASSNHLTAGRWTDLIPEFGGKVADAFRDGARAFWRRRDTLVQSEGAAANLIFGTDVLGLTGLAIEARGDVEWAGRLSAAEAARATRYATREINGFPSWLPQLFAVHPEPVLDVLVSEIEHQVGDGKCGGSHDYVLGHVAEAGSWCWEALGPRLVSLGCGART